MPPPSRDPNIFTTAQDADLGDAMAERFEGYLRTIDDAPLAENLTRIGTRLAAHLPPNEFKFQFRLIDIPDANAFVLPGGRVYVSRKLIGLTRSEDELADDAYGSGGEDHRGAAEPVGEAAGGGPGEGAAPWNVPSVPWTRTAPSDHCVEFASPRPPTL